MVLRASRKARLAERFVEIMDFFDDDRRTATVAEICHQYARPQSSTSELMQELTELGFLLRLPSKRYVLTPRAAFLGTGGQSDALRNGSLVTLLDRIVADTGLAAAVSRMSGLHSQIIFWRARPRSRIPGRVGMMRPLTQSAAGWLLLSTIEEARRDRIIRRLNAEASPEHVVAPARLNEVIIEGGYAGVLVGPSGLATASRQVAIIVPKTSEALVLSIAYSDRDAPGVEALVDCMREACRRVG